MTERNGRSIQVVAWLVLLGSFLVFVLTAVGIPWLGLRWVRESTRARPARVACKIGSCALSVHGAVPVAQRMESGLAEVPEGTTFATDGRSKGIVQFFDGSTANLEPNTSVTLAYMRVPRFSAGTSRPTTVLAVAAPSGDDVARLSIGTTWEKTDFLLRSEHGTARLAPESRARLEVRRDGMRLVVVEGSAEVTGADASVRAESDQVVECAVGGGPSAPRPALENVLSDSEFEGPMENPDWKERVDLPGSGANLEAPSAVYASLGDGLTSAVRISREQSDSRPADLILEQSLGAHDVTWSQQLSVKARLRVNGQSLPLGGTRGTEFPVILKLVGETENGAQYDWRVGFYAVLPPPEEPPDKYVAAPTDVQVQLGQWYDFESGNLLDADSTYSFARFDWPAPPARLLRFEIISSGHDYAADIDRVEVWVK